jgi:beta-lactam-binding protein with PASTA domain
MAFCGKCGAAINANAQSFCPACGAAVGNAPAPPRNAESRQTQQTAQQNFVEPQQIRPRGAKRGKAALIGILSGIATILIVAAGYWYFTVRQQPHVIVPDVAGMRQDEAASAITNAGLTVEIIAGEYHNTVPEGSIISQSLEAGASVAGGTEVNLIVSYGPQLVSVPDVSGMRQADAEAAITNAGLNTGTITHENHNTIPDGSVISQSLEAGTSVVNGMEVDLLVSSGRTVVIVERVSVPNVVRIPQADAEAAIKKAGLRVGTITSEPHDTVPTGSVISQSQAAGISVARGAGVNLLVSSGRPPQPHVPVPKVARIPQVEAESAILSAGLAVGTITRESHNTVPDGSVISQSLAAGTSVESGTAVDLRVSSGSEGMSGQPKGKAKTQEPKITLNAGKSFRVRTSSEVSTVTSNVGDRFKAVLTEDIMDGKRVIAERGSSVTGVVSESDPGGRVRGVATITLQIEELTLADGQTVFIKSDNHTISADSSVGRKVTFRRSDPAVVASDTVILFRLASSLDITLK